MKWAFLTLTMLVSSTVVLIGGFYSNWYPVEYSTHISTSVEQPSYPGQENQYIKFVGNFGDLVDIQNLSALDFANLEINSSYDVLLNSNGYLRRVSYQITPISQYQISPSGTKFAFSFTPDDSGQGDVVIMVFDTATKNLREVYRNNQRTSNYFWIDEQKIAINYNCGTGCMYRYVYDAQTSKILDEYLVNFPTLGKPTMATKRDIGVV